MNAVAEPQAAPKYDSSLIYICIQQDVYSNGQEIPHCEYVGGAGHFEFDQLGGVRVMISPIRHQHLPIIAACMAIVAVAHPSFPQQPIGDWADIANRADFVPPADFKRVEPGKSRVTLGRG